MEGEMQQSYFEVLGVCCPSETLLIHRILKPLEGVQKVSVNVATKTVIVVHNNRLISESQIVKVLNQARLDARVRSYGGRAASKMKSSSWPSLDTVGSGGRSTHKVKSINWPILYMVGSGVLLFASFFKSLYRPLHWLALAAAVVGLPRVILRSYVAIRWLVPDFNILLLIAVGGAVALGDYQEAGRIVFLFTFGEWVKSKSSDMGRGIMSSLMDEIAQEIAQEATIAESDAVVDPNEVKLNTVVVVKANEVIPIDGVVVGGSSKVDEKSLTGESLTVEKTLDSPVWAGTRNLTGCIYVRTTAVAEESAVAKKAKVVEEAHQIMSRTQIMIEEFAQYYSLIMVTASVGVAVVPATLRVHDLHHWLYLSLVLLLSARPCALSLSTPAATEFTGRLLASMGILIKGGLHLESLARVRVVAFDETCKFSVSHFHPDSRVATREKLLHWVASMEGKSNHPMASALVEYSKLNNIKPSSGSVKDFRLVPGEGISGDIDGNKISIGNKRMAHRLGCEDTAEEEEDEKKRGTRMGYVVVNGVVAATFGVRDEYRPGSDQVIQELKTMGIKTVMLTGDSKVSAVHLQPQSGNSKDFVHAELPPEGGKLSKIKDATMLGPTALVGDGINKAPALAGASVQIAMGVSAFATETSHVTLMSDDRWKIAVAIKLARKMKRKIVRNIMLYVVTKAVILGLAIAGHPLPWAAVLGDGGTTVVVNLNSTLLLLQQQEEQGHSHGVGGSSSKGDGCHKGSAPCGGHDKHHHNCEGTCKADSPCNSTSLGPSMEAHAHMDCPSNCHPHCEDSYCVKACTQVAMCRHLQTDVHVGAIPNAHTCEYCHHMVMCEHAHEGKHMHARGHGSTHQNSHGAIGDLEEVEVQGSEWAGEPTFMNHGACEGWYAEQEMRGSRCFMSVCEPSEGVCIHGRPCLSEITVIESGLPLSLSVSSRYP